MQDYARSGGAVSILERVSGEIFDASHPAARQPTERPPDPTWTEIKRDLPDDTLLSLNADLDQNNDPEVAQRGTLDAQ
jgi:hypothetical protein